ncbi:MAG: hypothetical protein POH28_13945, partial [Acidocella sp.]|nr:hypothetical protein [Acidocella sp.]
MPDIPKFTGGLRREAGRLGLLFASVGGMIGSGWLFGALNAARIAGPAALISWVIGGVAVLLLNLLVGNMNWTGGLTAGGGGYNVKKGLYDIESVPEAEGLVKGVIINREKFHYEDTSEYKAKLAAGKNPYPSKRPWFPLSSNMFTETLPSAIQRYPYGVDILMWHKATPLYSVPSQGNPEFVAAVKNPKNIPLIIATDIVVGDSSMYADYIVP